MRDEELEDWEEEDLEGLSGLEVVAVVALGACGGLVVLAIGLTWGALGLARQALEAVRQ